MKHLMTFENFVNENYKTDEKFLGNVIDTVKKTGNKLFGEKPVTEEEALNIINSHSAKKQAYEKLLESDPEKAKLYLTFISQHPSVLYAKWVDKVKGDPNWIPKWVDAGKYTATHRIG
jgi:hypothetical protein